MSSRINRISASSGSAQAIAAPSRQAAATAPIRRTEFANGKVMVPALSLTFVRLASPPTDAVDYRTFFDEMQAERSIRRRRLVCGPRP